MKKINFSIDEEYKKYALKQFILYLVITFFLYILFFFEFGLVFAGLVVWVIFIFFVLIIYIDLKLSYNFYIQKKQIENLEYIINFLNKGDKK